MNKHWMICLCLLTTLSLSSAFNSYGQQVEKHEDGVFAHPNVTGVGTHTVVYHLTTPLETTTLAELKNYMESLNAITEVAINGQDISLRFKEITTNEMIHLFIQRMEMLYVYRNPQSK